MALYDIIILGSVCLIATVAAAFLIGYFMLTLNKMLLRSKAAKVVKGEGPNVLRDKQFEEGQPVNIDKFKLKDQEGKIIAVKFSKKEEGTFPEENKDSKK